MAEGDTLSLGEHELTFVMAPMVHWPEVMMEYESKDKVLFQQMASESSEHLILMRTGPVRQDVIILILLENMVHRFRLYSRKQQGLDINIICPSSWTDLKRKT